MRPSFLLLTPLLLLLGACSSSDTLPPSIDEFNVPISLNPQMELRVRASDDRGVAAVRILASLPAGDLPLGQTKTFPYVISPDTSRLPNLSPVEVRAEVEDAAGNRTRSNPVKTQVTDERAPALAYFAGFTYPDSAVAGQSIGGARRPSDFNPETVRPPQERAEMELTGGAVQPSALRPLDTPRAHAVEWGWLPVGNVLGYNLYHSAQATAEFARRRGIQAVNGDPLVRQAEFLTGEEQGKPAFGLFTTLTSNGESPFSNAAQAQFLPEQEIVSPVEGESVVGGRPTLTWVANPSSEVAGYLFFVYTKNPEVQRTVPVWSSDNGQTTSRTTAVYPGGHDALPAGTYYWRVAAVSFTKQGAANGFSYSRVRSFQVQP